MAEARKPQESAEATGGHVCQVGFCPLGMLLTVSERARPEAVEHLMAAGRELMLALAAMVNARVDDLGRSSGLEKIELE